jgi:hypothetical protein
MNKKLLILAVAGLALASCSNDEVVESAATSDANAISFRPLMNNVTRTANAAGLKTAFESGDVISVYANYNSSKYFQDNFTSDGSTFSSTNKYYWPSDVATNHVTFTAIWGPSLSSPALTIGTTAGNFTGYTPNATATNQEDILIAKHESSTKESPVAMNFRHTLSQIVVNAKNSNPNLKVTITGVRIGYIKTASSSFTYSGGVTDTRELGTANNAANVSQSDWTLVDFAGTPTTTTANDYKYDQTVSLTLTGQQNVAQPLTSYAPWILLPQNMTNADTDTDGTPNYATTKTGTKGTANPDFAGSYIALNMQIENYNGTAATGTIVSTQWCYWPITQDWTPGYKYTYVIDVAGGGYEPEDTDNDGEGDPVLDGSVIVFSPSCTIDAWDPQEVAVSGGI